MRKLGLFGPANVVVGADEAMGPIVEVRDLADSDFRNPADRPVRHPVDIPQAFGDTCCGRRREESSKDQVQSSRARAPAGASETVGLRRDGDPGRWPLDGGGLNLATRPKGPYLPNRVRRLFASRDPGAPAGRQNRLASFRHLKPKITAPSSIIPTPGLGRARWFDLILEDTMTTIEMRRDPLDGVWRDNMSRWLGAQKMERSTESEISPFESGAEPEGETVEPAPIGGSVLEPRWPRIFPSL
jgi:hypothetical protein